MQSFIYLTPEDFSPNTDSQQEYIKVLVSWSQGKVYWDLHPIFKSSSVITSTKSLNKIISDCFSTCLPTVKLPFLRGVKEVSCVSSLLHLFGFEPHLQFQVFGPIKFFAYFFEQVLLNLLFNKNHNFFLDLSSFDAFLTVSEIVLFENNFDGEGQFLKAE